MYLMTLIELWPSTQWNNLAKDEKKNLAQEGKLQLMSIKVIIDRDLEPLNTQQITLKNEFTKYKELSLAKGTRNFITPPIGIQMVEPSVHLSFGRDT